MEDKEIKYAVFDDIAGGMKFFHMFKQWFGCQHEISVKRLYRDPKLMVWDRPSIWVSNTNPLLDMPPEDANWMEANCIFLDVNEKLYYIDERAKRGISEVEDAEEQRLARGGSPDMSDEEGLFVTQE